MVEFHGRFYAFSRGFFLLLVDKYVALQDIDYICSIGCLLLELDGTSSRLLMV